MLNEERVRFSPPFPIDVTRTLAPLRRGRFDRTCFIDSAGVWRATRTPEGPATQFIRNIGSEIESRSWGQGAQWLAERAQTLVGCDDDTTDFPDVMPAISALHHRFCALRILRTQNIFEALLPVVLEQKVTALEARRSYARMVCHFGIAAPGSSGAPPLLLPPDPAAVAGSPAHVFQGAGVEAKRGDTIRIAASYIKRLREAAELSISEASAVIAKLPGIGLWTVAEIGLVALGDADAVSVGDYHLKNWVSWNLASRARGTDEEMLELLEPFRPHRGRALRYLQLGGAHPPRYGPRLTIQPRY